MATKVYMEALSPTMEEGTLISWLKKEGDEVKEGDILAEVETDKATMELVARGSGVMRKHLLADGGTTAVGTVIAVIGSADEDIGSIVGGAEAQAEPASEAAPSPENAVAEASVAPKPEGVAAAGTAEQKVAAGASAEQGGSEGEGGRLRASPVARRIAEESGIELSGVQGSGPGGRIVKRDVEAAIEGGAAAGAQDQAAEAAEEPAFAAAAASEGIAYRDLPLSQMRKTIAKRLSQSIGPIPHFFLTVEVDMTEAMAFRKKVNDRFAKEGIKTSPNDLVIKAVAAALRKHPWVNSAWTGEAIRQYDVVHIGVAVAVDEGLITPVIRNADRKGIAEIASEVKELAGRAREKKLKPEEYTGGTFSISNLGMFGISEFTAVINPPEAAILAVGAVEDKVVAVDGEMKVQPRMRMTLSCDHRVIDGATGAQFLQTLKSNLEDPMMMVA